MRNGTNLIKKLLLYQYIQSLNYSFQIPIEKDSIDIQSSNSSFLRQLKLADKHVR
jgi:hypothetical protein